MAEKACALRVGFVLMPDFTMLALAGFLDTLRLAADEGDRSRPIQCSWTVMSETGRAVAASNGVSVQPDSMLSDPAAFDYVVVVGGTLHRVTGVSDALAAFLKRASFLRVPLVGICTGGFALARAGLMAGHRCCVSWFHRREFEIEFSDIEVVADQLFVIDRDRITCAGGTSVVHLASSLIERHLGPGSSAKGLRIMIEERARSSTTAQPLPPVPGLDEVRDNRVRRAMLLIERSLSDRHSLAAIARHVGTTPRHLARLFQGEVGDTPAMFRRQLRLERARQMVEGGAVPITEIALRCGFADAAHLSRAYRRYYGKRPSDSRR